MLLKYIVISGYEVTLEASKKEEEKLQARVKELEEKLLAEQKKTLGLSKQLEQMENELEKLQQKSKFVRTNLTRNFKKF